MRVAAVVPAYDAARTVGQVVRDLASVWPQSHTQPIIVVDDGSRDDTAQEARAAGALVVCHGINRGKGAAIRTGLRVAKERGFDAAVTVDADRQHPAHEAARLASHNADAQAIVLGIRDLKRAGAPRANQFSNGISNVFLSAFTRTILRDTQCGLRRYPIDAVLALDARADGYAFEAEVLLLARRAGLPFVQVPIEVLYNGIDRHTHFDSVRDPARIIAYVLRTLARRAPARLE